MRLSAWNLYFNVQWPKDVRRYAESWVRHAER
jgi:hypothetical protein